MGMQKYRAILLKLGDIHVETVEVLNSVINIILVILLLSWCLKFNDDQHLGHRDNQPQWPREEHWGAVVMISCKSVWDRISRRAPRNPTAPPLISLKTTQISPRSKSQFQRNCKFLKNQSYFVYSTCRLAETGAMWDLFCSGTKLEDGKHWWGLSIGVSSCWKRTPPEPSSGQGVLGEWEWSYYRRSENGKQLGNLILRTLQQYGGLGNEVVATSMNKKSNLRPDPNTSAWNKEC